MTTSIMDRPTLDVDCGDNMRLRAWRIYANLTFESGRSYSLRIRHDAIEDVITRLVHDMGDEFEGLTQAEFNERVQTVLDNEPDMTRDDARGLIESRCVHLNDAQITIFEGLERYWVAVSTLLRPAVTL